MKQVFFLFFMFPFIGIIAQERDNPLQDGIVNDSIKVVDKNYREDQFYVSVTYNLLGNKPDNVSQSGFSSGFHLGFIRDMPINEKRNVAIGLGLGLSSNSYNQSLLISENNRSFNYTILEDVSFSKNKFTTYLIEVPLEFRWRTSTATEYDFWRIYSGIKLGYVVYNTSKFIGSPNNIQLTNIDDINKLQYGLTLSAGYSNINFHFYYALNSIFNKNAKVNSSGELVKMNAIKIGLIFYIL
ncbi:porin family protein [Psychroserpens sp. Hel_I_66]|uniref:porin family protein n=1 Tax=Psychroserpens sp. Hel_I_66 TaxID=1250004 RepID=UPI00064827F8|nr:porin family protein [Psychroserpens sp. Hel_I_66]